MLDALPVWVSLVIPGFFLAMSAVAIAAAVHARKVAGAVQSTEVAHIASAGPGIAAFEGSVAAPMGRSIESTLTGSPCCWFHVKVEKRIVQNADRSGSGRWATIAEYTSCEPFLMSDGTGMCGVFPDGAEVTPTDRSVWYGATPVPADRNPKRVGPGESTEAMLQIESSPNRQYRYTEERIYDGDPLYVLGRFDRGAVADDDDDDFDPNGPSLAKAQYGVTAEDLAPYARETWGKRSRFLEMRAAVKSAAHARIAGGGSGRHRFVLSTTRRDTLVAMNRGGAAAALFVAAVPAAIAAWFVWARFFR